MYIGEYAGATEKEYANQYLASKCLKCGLCLEICPNYVKGNDFFGALFANEAYLSYTQSQDRKELIRSEYKKHFSKGCSKALSCVSVCPVQIPTLASMAKMNGKK